MEGFRPRDYLASAVIIIGVLSVWFLLIAGLMGVTEWQIALPIVIVVGLIIYVLVKRRTMKN